MLLSSVEERKGQAAASKRSLEKALKIFRQEKNKSGEVKALHHLANLELRRPLDTIADPTEQGQARAVRAWLKREFLT